MAGPTLRLLLSLHNDGSALGAGTRPGAQWRHRADRCRPSIGRRLRDRTRLLGGGLRRRRDVLPRRPRHRASGRGRPLGFVPDARRVAIDHPRRANELIDVRYGTAVSRTRPGSSTRPARRAAERGNNERRLGSLSSVDVLLPNPPSTRWRPQRERTSSDTESRSSKQAATAGPLLDHEATSCRRWGGWPTRAVSPSVALGTFATQREEGRGLERRAALGAGTSGTGCPAGQAEDDAPCCRADGGGDGG